METRITGVHLRSAIHSVLLECVQPQPQTALELKFTAELPYDSYRKLLRCTCCKNKAEFMNKTNLDFEIAGPNTLVIRDRLAGRFKYICSPLPKSCKAWIVNEHLPFGESKVFFDILALSSCQLFSYYTSTDEYKRLKAIAGIAPEALLTKGIITVKRNGVVGVGNFSHLFVTIDENSKVYFQNCILVKNFDVSMHFIE